MQYEIEIKSLLGDKAHADALVEKITSLGAVTVGSHSQLNHYFTGIVNDSLDNIFTPYIADEDQRALLQQIVEKGEQHSVRTREADGNVLLVIKAAIDDTSSENGIARIEFEQEFTMTLDELDRRLLGAGFVYQAKWSRERTEYTLNGTTIALDKNAGYGYIAEFEQITDDASAQVMIELELRSLMAECGVEELSQERLTRMFEYYNAHWEEYYGTDKIFVIE